MSKKHKKSAEHAIVQPILASILLATALPLVSLVSARSETIVDDSPEGVLSSNDFQYKLFRPRENQTKLFDPLEFRKLMRANHQDGEGPAQVEVEVPASEPASSQPAINPCDPEAVSSAPAAEETKALKLEDLSTNELNDLRRQLRIGGCPYDVATGYRLLCE